MRIKNSKLLYILTALIFFTASCKKSASNEAAPTSTPLTTSTTSTGANISSAADAAVGKPLFVSATSLGSFTVAQLQSMVTIKGFQSFLPSVQYGVDFYKLTYNTTYNGVQIQASGLLAIPKNTPSAPALLSAQHGTIFANSDAPSNFPNSFTGYELFAAAGFVTVIPDYIGYGVSGNIVHPYYDTQYSGSVVVDMLKAAKYYLSTQSKPITNKLFLVGYSEGGYVTLAAQKAIETNTTNNLTLTAAVEGAGCYDLVGMLSGIAEANTYPDPSLLALVINSYNKTYNWNRPLSDFFAAPYAAAIPQLLNGTKSQTQINSALTTSVSTLFTSTFYNDLESSAGEITLKAQFTANSFPTWYPKSATRLYHGTLDEDVPYQTSVSTYTKFITGGSKDLLLIPIYNGTHETSVQPMMLDALTWMKTLQ
jgi:pimeloyl-ACP methyl ester carboxylesterase